MATVPGSRIARNLGCRIWHLKIAVFESATWVFALQICQPGTYITFLLFRDDGQGRPSTWAEFWKAWIRGIMATDVSERDGRVSPTREPVGN
jgi:hypothetical protein